MFKIKCTNSTAINNEFDREETKLQPDLQKYPCMTVGHNTNQWQGETETVGRFLRALRVEGIPVTEAFHTQKKNSVIVSNIQTPEICSIASYYR